MPQVQKSRCSSRCKRSFSTAKLKMQLKGVPMERAGFLALSPYRMLSMAVIASLSLTAALADDDGEAFLPRLVVSSTVPLKGDLNPYGVAFVPPHFPTGGTIPPGD